MNTRYEETRVTRLDICFGGSLVTVSLALGINILIQSVYLVYAVIVLVLAGLAHAARKYDRENSFEGALDLGTALPGALPIFRLFV